MKRAMANDVCAIVGFGPGIGMAVAERFAREGFALQLFARDQPTLDGYVEQFREQGVKAFGTSADAGNFDELERAMSAAAEELGPPSVLVYNAATKVPDRASIISPKDLSAAFDVNTTGMIAAAQFALRDMGKQGRGTILITGGEIAVEPAASHASMSAGKAALRSLAITLAEDAADVGVHVAYFSNGVSIGPGSDEARIIGDAYWNLHAQTRDEWQTDVEWHGRGWWPYADGGAWVRKRAIERVREERESLGSRG